MSSITRTSKLKIVGSAVVSILCIVSIILFVVNAKGINSKLVILAVIICALAIVSLAIAIMSRIVRNEYTKTLSSKYYEAFEEIKDGIKRINLTRLEKKEVIDDVTSMLYHAQKEKRSVDEVIGEDSLSFIEKIKDAYGKRNAIVFAILNGILYLAFVLFWMQFVTFAVGEEGKTFFETSISISILPYMALLCFAVIPIARNSMAKKKSGIAIASVVTLVIVYFAAHEALYLIEHSADWINGYLYGKFIFLSSYSIIITVIVICALCLALKIFLRRRSIKRL